ncbi:MAG: hypothetical protein HC933_13380, partial [Pleurocapsa sp. SU_196_0]|nr:hypothetical protein [Pleurocapsa sp. SU_196_0]
MYYGNNLEYAAHLDGYDLGIVQPNTLSLKALRELKARGKRLVAYITIGESDGPSIGLPEAWVLGTNENWGSKFVDANQVGWQDRVLERAADIVSFGFDGFFLDTLDTVDVYPRTKPGMVRIVERLRERFPEAIIVQNRGFAVLEETAPLVDAVMFEAYSTDFDFEARQYKASSGDASAVTPYLGRHLKILALDYADQPALKTRALEARPRGGIHSLRGEHHQPQYPRTKHCPEHRKEPPVTRHMIAASRASPRRTLRRDEAMWGWLLVLPSAVGILVFAVIPILGSLGVSFTNWGGLSAPRFTGLSNYARAVQDRACLAVHAANPGVRRGRVTLGVMVSLGVGRDDS